ncbi:RNA polymerase sigma factor [bacterium]|nr:RNA polymerase sigma factor [bacterium]
MKQILPHNDSFQKEEKWIELSKRDPEAFQYIFNKYHHQIFNFVLRRVYCHDTAQDITANVFMKALEKIHQFKCKGIPFSAWLYRIAINEINLHYRSRKRIVALTDERSLHLVHENRTDDTLLRKEETAEKAKRFKKIYEAIATLKPKYQHAIALRYFEEKSMKEIALILGLSENTVKTHIHRGLQQLRDKL